MWVRILVIFAVLVIVGGLYLWCFGEQTIWVLESRYMGWKVPIVKQKLTELQDLSTSNGPGRTLSYFGYEFQVPWEGLDESATKASSTRVLLTFRSGQRLLFYSGQPKEFVKTLLSSAASDPNALEQVYGREVFDSDYAFIHHMLDTTPSKITLWTPRKDAVGNLMMLTMKAIATPLADTGMFSIHTRDFKGFQYGNPEKKPKRVLVDLFADDGTLELTFIGSDKQDFVNIPQADINRIVQTVHKAKASVQSAEVRKAAMTSNRR